MDLAMQLLRWVYAAAALATLVVLLTAGRRWRRYPWFAAMLLSTAAWMVVYAPRDERWLHRWVPLMYLTTVPLRLMAALEVIWRISEGFPPRRRIMLFATAGLAIGWTIIACRVRGADTYTAIVQVRNYLQVGTCVLLLVPMVAFGVTDHPGTGRCGQRDMTHGWTLVVLLAVHGVVSWLVIAGGILHHITWLTWESIDIASYAVAIGCCARWITLWLSPRRGPGASPNA